MGRSLIQFVHCLLIMHTHALNSRFGNGITVSIPACKDVQKSCSRNEASHVCEPRCVPDSPLMTLALCIDPSPTHRGQTDYHKSIVLPCGSLCKWINSNNVCWCQLLGICYIVTLYWQAFQAYNAYKLFQLYRSTEIDCSHWQVCTSNCIGDVGE